MGIKYHPVHRKQYIGHINWFSSAGIETEYLFSGVLHCSVFFPTQCHHIKGKIEGVGKLLVAKLLIANVSNKSTGMFHKSELLEAHSTEGFRSNPFWDETRCSVDA